MSLDALLTAAQPLASVDELAATFRAAERVPGQGLVGLEHEKLIVANAGTKAVPYAGAAGIEALLQGFVDAEWEPFREGPGFPVIAALKGRAALSLEPGGQFELSGSPFKTAREAHAENVAHAHQLTGIADRLGLRALGLGYRAFDRLAEMPWMPKSRYGAMRQTLGARGAMAQHMMQMTATGQVSLDWFDEADCAAKVTACARMTPVMVALFANSPIVEGAESGFQSFRSRVWNEVDPARCGVPAFMLDGSFSYQAYVEWALDAPLLFLRRDGRYLTPALTFRQLLRDGFEGQPALRSDWVDHLSTLFPEVRIKAVLEVRSADGNSVALTGALAALMRGLLYDSNALDHLLRLMPLSPADHHALHLAAQRDGLAAVAAGRALLPLARDVVGLARAGLKRLDPDDVPLLEPLEDIVAAGQSPAVATAAAFRARVSDSAFLDRFRL